MTIKFQEDLNLDKENLEIMLPVDLPIWIFLIEIEMKLSASSTTQR